VRNFATDCVDLLAANSKHQTQLLMRHTLFIALFAAALSVIGCGGTKEIQKAELGQVPDWYLSPPQDKNSENPTMIYGTATEVSQDLQFAINKAETSARVKIASQMETTVQGMLKKFREETGSGQEPQLLQMTTEVEKTVVNTKLVGARISKKEVVKDGNLFRAYVLAEYNTEGAKKLMLDEIKKNERAYTRFRASKAFGELEKEIEKQDAAKKGN
jgi:hypothetical protein